MTPAKRQFLAASIADLVQHMAQTAHWMEAYGDEACRQHAAELRGAAETAKTWVAGITGTKETEEPHATR